MCVVLCGIGGLFAAAFSMRSTTPAGVIERVLEADVEAGGSSSDPAAVAKAMKEIDLSGCPPEFQEAYVDHIDAWERSGQTRSDAQAWIDRHVPGQFTIDELYNTQVPPGLSPEAELQRQAVIARQMSATQAIQSTYDRVLRTAQQHGARTPVEPNGP